MVGTVQAHKASTGAFSECASTSCARPTSLIFAFMVLLSSTFFVFRSECMTCSSNREQDSRDIVQCVAAGVCTCHS